MSNVVSFFPGRPIARNVLEGDKLAEARRDAADWYLENILDFIVESEVAGPLSAVGALADRFSLSFDDAFDAIRSCGDPDDEATPAAAAVERAAKTLACRKGGR